MTAALTTTVRMASNVACASLESRETRIAMSASRRAGMMRVRSSWSDLSEPGSVCACIARSVSVMSFSSMSTRSFHSPSASPMSARCGAAASRSG
jgi:hypothetical protein